MPPVDLNDVDLRDVLSKMGSMPRMPGVCARACVRVYVCMCVCVCVCVCV